MLDLLGLNAWYTLLRISGAYEEFPNIQINKARKDQQTLFFLSCEIQEIKKSLLFTSTGWWRQFNGFYYSLGAISSHSWLEMAPCERQKPFHFLHSSASKQLPHITIGLIVTWHCGDRCCGRRRPMRLISDGPPNGLISIRAASHTCLKRGKIL